MNTTRTIYILYNANASIMGKLRYGYAKLKRGPETQQPVCGACDITHGGLSLSESPGWLSAKSEIEKSGDLRVAQLHRDELTVGISAWMSSNGTKFPCVISGMTGDGDEHFELVFAREELNTFAGDPKALIQALKRKGIINEAASL